MVRYVKYMTRPTVRRALVEAKRMGLKDKHARPTLRQLPTDVRFPVVFAHPWHTRGYARSLVLWEKKNMAWWMDIPLLVLKRLPKMEVTVHAYRA